MDKNIEKEILKDRIIQRLKTIHDPEIPLNIYELGLIYEIDIDNNNDVLIVMTLTAPNCPVAESLPLEVEEAVKQTEGVNNVQVQITFEPAWSMDKLSDEAKLELGFL
ncbi:MAG: SUF system Fe-S cluster assembly protein [Bacteroidales bacterium]|jgi:FeS assembly SUF system protein|nr:SUF system Fe-S cluster assembly protein [Bacteroidales bacterium]MEE1142628.1 SUF system Fe-S cluster assembly protein [Bacteroidales bacterium]